MTSTDRCKVAGNSIQASRIGEYQVSITRLEKNTDLATDWLKLEKQVNPSIFTSWLWISTWLDQIAPPPALLAKVYANQEIVALGVFILKKETRYSLLSSNTARLHQTGLEHEDQVWIEYNALLASPEHKIPALLAVERVLFNEGYCDELKISMLSTTPDSSAYLDRENVNVDLEVVGYKRNLALCRQKKATVLQAVSSNTRQQIRRSMRLYSEQFGKPTILDAQTAEEALRMFDEAGSFHKQRWIDSGFHNAAFTDFHKDLIKRGFDHGNIRLSQLHVGNRLLGVFYFMIYGNTAYFYLQGLRHENNGKLKPGLCGHSLLMQDFLDQGVDEYDFMGGDSQYKQQLADCKNAFVSVRTHNGDWKFLIEDGARHLKRLMFKH
ncbi:GNAT family N-acetyltransferase [Congregibacter brevis]|uniref:GNAT family N-acetyltransferase n=1 Tax=Congregibacter brevis TaxID=3081201 RepID=A0ABZ0IGX4_9GAMM|nr:GNAT family N-acetyltransferase [Congregibacter sp. IMCC45268]